MENLKLLFQLYIRPAFAMSEIIDKGSWLIAAVMMFIVSLIFYATVNTRLHVAYPTQQEILLQNMPIDDQDDGGAEYEATIAAYQKAMAERQLVPVVGDRLFNFFSFDPSHFYVPLLSLAAFYVPVTILLISLFAPIGRFGLVLQRDYGTLSTCAFMAWSAAHLPFAAIGVLLYQQTAAPEIYLALWLASGLLFGIFMIFALRTVLGVEYSKAILTVAVSWIGFSLGMYAFRYISPFLFSPFLLFFGYLYFGGYLRGEARGMGNAFRQRQNFKRFLQNATINPNDSDAHVQLGLIYKQRRQDSKAIEHFEKALAIDPNEIDANYEMGKIAREKGEFQKAIDHFSAVVEQNDKHALSEVWREIGLTYYSANMLVEARNAFETFIERRAFDPEGLYHYGKTLKALGENEKAREAFESAIESAESSPDYRRHEQRQWGKLARKEIG